MPGRRVYDLLYRTGAAKSRRGWEVGVGPELERLVREGRLTPDAVGGNRALDLGCGAGTNVLFLARSGFDATGVDFSSGAIDRARHAASDADLTVTLVVADITRPIPSLRTPFDVVLLHNVLQDLGADGRRGLADETARLTRSGSVVLLWCWYGRKKELPLVSYRGPSKIAPFVVEPGEEDELFGDAFTITAMEPDPGPRRKAFVLVRT